MRPQEAFNKYTQWQDNNFPPLNLTDTLIMAIGYLYDCTDGRPDLPERRLFNALFEALKQIQDPEPMVNIKVFDPEGREICGS